MAAQTISQQLFNYSDNTNDMSTNSFFHVKEDIYNFKAKIKPEANCSTAQASIISRDMILPPLVPFQMLSLSLLSKYNVAKYTGLR